MKKKDFIWILGLASIIFFLVYRDTHNIFVSATKEHPYIMGFIKIAILATMGELLAARITTGNYCKQSGILLRFIIWGILGMAFALVFDLFANGVSGSMNKGLLPSIKDGSNLSKLLTAFFTSSLMNMIFGPTFMALHRVTDTYIDLGNGKLSGILKVKLRDVTHKINWYSFVDFVVLKTIPFFWIPAHTITFYLPSEYRVLMAAFLSIVLGGILSFAKRKAAD